MTNMPHTEKLGPAAVLAIMVASNMMLPLEVCIVITVIGLIGDIVFGIVRLFVTNLLLPAIGLVFSGGFIAAIFGSLIAASAAFLRRPHGGSSTGRHFLKDGGVTAAYRYGKLAPE